LYALRVACTLTRETIGGGPVARVFEEGRRRKREERTQECAVGTRVGGGQGFLLSPLPR
jgi:hypothetical protein